MTEPMPREECREAMTRVHERVDTIERTSAQIETSAKNIEKCVNDIKSVMYGSEKADGIITKVSNLNQKVGGIYWLGGVIIIAMIGALVGLIFKK